VSIRGMKTRVWLVWRLLCGYVPFTWACFSSHCARRVSTLSLMSFFLAPGRMSAGACQSTKPFNQPCTRLSPHADQITGYLSNTEVTSSPSRGIMESFRHMLARDRARSKEREQPLWGGCFSLLRSQTGDSCSCCRGNPLRWGPLLL